MEDEKDLRGRVQDAAMADATDTNGVTIGTSSPLSDGSSGMISPMFGTGAYKHTDVRIPVSVFVLTGTLVRLPG